MRSQLPKPNTVPCAPSTGVWPAGTYVERYGGGEATVRVEPYRQYRDVQLITIEVRIDGSRKRIVHRQLVECAE